MDFTPPAKDCRLCERLCSFREANRLKFPSYHNAPVEPFGSLDAEILIVGLAPGLNGANRPNRPFTNDYAGDVLYPVLKTYGLARGNYQKRKDDGYELLNVRITNAVRCVPPENKPTTAEEKNCRQFLAAEIAAMPNLKVILCLGTISHKNVLQALGLKQSFAKFSHGAVYPLPSGTPSSAALCFSSAAGFPAAAAPCFSSSGLAPQPLSPVAPHSRSLTLIDSYHTSRYNINTGVLTYAMFEEIIKKIKGLI